jgi:iron complex outermembrane recepter protein
MTKRHTGKSRDLLFVTFASVGAYIATGAVSPAFSQEDADITWLDTIIVTASRGDEELKKTPNAISVVTPEEVEKVKFVTAQDELLPRVPGTSLGRNLRFPFGGKNYTVNLRDGLQMRPFGSGYTGALNEINRWDIERIEIIKGPASALYGSNAVGGVINIITKAPPLEPEYSVWCEGGSWGRLRTGITAGGTVDTFGYTLNANLIRSDGWRDRTAKEEEAVSLKGLWQATTDTKLTVRGEYQEQWDQQPGSLTAAEYEENWRQAGITDAYEDNSFATISGTLDHQFGENASGKVAYSGRQSTAEGPTALSYKSGYIDENSIDHNMTLQYQRDYAFLASKIVVGSDLQYSDFHEKSYQWENGVNTEPGELEKDWDLLARVGSPFAQLQFSPVDWAEFTFGARYDYVEYTGTDNLGEKGTITSTYQNLSKKAGVNFTLSEDHSVWLSYGEAFVVPSRSRLFASSAYYSRGRPSGYNADPNLDPETAKNYSLGLRGTFVEGRVGYDMSLYHTNITDMVVGIDRYNDGTLDGRVYVNAGEVTGQGLEGSFFVKPNDMLSFDAAYTYAVNKYTDFEDAGIDYTGNHVSASPLHHLNARVTITPIEGLDVELELDHISDYFTSNANDDPEGKYQRPDLWHLRVNYEDGPWSYWGQVRNLGNIKYADGVSNSSYSGRKYSPGEARSFAVGARYKF